MGLLPIRDISSFTSVSPDITEHLAADALLARLAVGHEALARREHRHPEATEDPRQPVGPAVDPQAGLGDALQPADHSCAVGGVLERDLEQVTRAALSSGRS